jgi:hypothetical protein
MVRITRILAVFALTTVMTADSVFAGLNATVTNGNVHLRKSYPTFELSTLLTFQLPPGESLAVVPEGTRIEVTSRRIIANKYEWFSATYAEGARVLVGWIYAGELGARQYLQIDPGVERQLPMAATSTGPMRLADWSVPALNWLMPTLQASTDPLEGRTPVPEPIVYTDPLRTLLLSVAHVAIFLSALMAIRRWAYPTSNTFSFLASLCIMVILGFMSKEALPDVLETFLARK